MFLLVKVRAYSNFLVFNCINKKLNEFKKNLALVMINNINLSISRS